MQKINMDRNEKALYFIKKDGAGLEIGPSHNPIAPKSKGFKVEIIDHMSREDLIKKYTGHGVDLNNIEEVDFVWSGQSYKELTQKEGHYDFIIASHVIEHSPDLIAFLNDCEDILKDDGILSLVIPDMRYCFDHFRPHTGISKVIDSHIRKDKIHTQGTAIEYYLNVVSKSGSIAWNEGDQGEFSLVHNINDAKHASEIIAKENAYIDLHSWCFTPNSFRLIVQDLQQLGLIKLKEVGFFPTNGCEFYFTLSKSGKGTQTSRIEILNAIQDEIAATNK